MSQAGPKSFFSFFSIIPGASEKSNASADQPSQNLNSTVLQCGRDKKETRACTWHTHPFLHFHHVFLPKVGIARHNLGSLGPEESIPQPRAIAHSHALVQRISNHPIPLPPVLTFLHILSSTCRPQTKHTQACGLCSHRAKVAQEMETRQGRHSICHQWRYHDIKGDQRQGSGFLV